ncbi:MAG: hypothetical protein NWR72_17325 [Bacteroidia bacterium]|nr:hypothetical protein [Bacteroidia bacterium]
MKSIFLLLGILCPISAFSQLFSDPAPMTIGQWWIGGSLSLNQSASQIPFENSRRDLGANFSPQTHVFLSDRMAFIMSVGLSYASSSTDFAFQASRRENLTWRVALVPGLRYYYPLNANFYLFGQATLSGGFAYSRARAFDPPANVNVQESRSQEYSLAGAGGITVLLTRHLAVDFTPLRLGYFYNTNQTQGFSGLNGRTFFSFTPFSPGLTLYYRL